MAFVYEDLPPEKGDKLQKKYKFINPFGGHEVNPRMWAVDKGRDAFLIALGWDGHNEESLIKREKYVLIWNGKQAYITAYMESPTQIGEGNTPALVTEEIKAPAELLADINTKLELQAMVKEALFALRGAHFPPRPDRKYRQHGEPITIEKRQ